MALFAGDYHQRGREGEATHFWGKFDIISRNLETVQDKR